jgi:hypothetical protein
VLQYISRSQFSLEAIDTVQKEEPKEKEEVVLPSFAKLETIKPQEATFEKEGNEEEDKSDASSIYATALEQKDEKKTLFVLNDKSLTGTFVNGKLVGKGKSKSCSLKDKIGFCMQQKKFLFLFEIGN